MQMAGRDDDEQLAQMTELERLHAAFHAAVSVHDPVHGDSPAVITQRNPRRNRALG